MAQDPERDVKPDITQAGQAANSASTSNLFTVVTSNNERFSLTLDQIRFNSPNYFTAAFEGDFEESTSRIVHLPNRCADVFQHISNWLAGEDIFPVKIKGETDEKAVRLILENSQYFSLEGLKQDATAALEYFKPAIPAFPLSETTSAVFDRVADFQKACRTGMVGEETLEDIVKKENGPFVLFEFKDLQVSISRSVLGIAPVKHFRVTFQRSTEASAMAGVSTVLASYGYRTSSPRFRYRTLSAGWSELNKWLDSDRVRGPASFPTIEKAFGKYCTPNSNTTLINLDLQVVSAKGFFKANQVYLCYTVLDEVDWERTW